MGQAKNRGTLEERMAQSLAAKRKAAEALGLVERSLDEVREEYGVPAGAPFLGYIVHIPETDEFLASFKNGAHATARHWTRDPGLAMRFDHFPDAHSLAREGREIVVGLFETDTQFLVAGVL